MTEEEFRHELQEFWRWVSKRERPASHWFYSLEEWAKSKGNEAYAKQAKS